MIPPLPALYNRPVSTEATRENNLQAKVYLDIVFITRIRRHLHKDAKEVLKWVY